jgi:hypothetical protein
MDKSGKSEAAGGFREDLAYEQLPFEGQLASDDRP